MQKIFVSTLFIFCTVTCYQAVFAEGSSTSINDQIEKAIKEKLISAASANGQADTPSLTKEDRIFGLVKIYSAAKQHFAYFEQVPELDWDKAFKEYLPIVEKEQSLLEYYRTLQKFTALLKDGHTFVRLPEQLRNQLDRLPLRLEYIQNEWVVTERMPSEEILKEDIPVGSIVVAVDGMPVNEYIEKTFFPYLGDRTIQARRASINWMSYFQKGQEVKVSLKYPDGSPLERVIHANCSEIKWSDELHKKYTSVLRQGPDFKTRKLPDDILYVSYRQCTKETQDNFCTLIDAMPTFPKSLILDLRGNSGGMTPEESVAHLITSNASYKCKTRWSISFIDAVMNFKTDKDFRKAVIEDWRKRMKLPDTMDVGWFTVTDEIQPASKTYKGKLVVLIDSETGSAAEDTVVLLQSAGRGKIIGEPSRGSTGTPLMIDLPGGGGCRICTYNCTYPDGKKFVGVGIQPDIPVQRTIAGITKGQDEILEAAISHLQNRTCVPGQLQKEKEDSYYVRIVRQWDMNEAIKPFNIIMDDPNDPNMTRLRTQYGLEKLTPHGADESEKLKAILKWVHSRWEHNGDNIPSQSDPLTILKEVSEGKRFRCVEYAIVTAASARAMGMPSRVLALKRFDVETAENSAGHVVAEIWLEQFNKWVFVDGQFGAIPEVNGVALNAVEFQNAIAHRIPELEIWFSTEGQTADSYISWVGPYLYYFDFNIDQRFFVKNYEKQRYTAPHGKIMLVPKGADKPKVFQMKTPIKNCTYISNPNAFYPQLNR